MAACMCVRVSLPAYQRSFLHEVERNDSNRARPALSTHQFGFERAWIARHLSFIRHLSTHKHVRAFNDTIRSISLSLTHTSPIISHSCTIFLSRLAHASKLAFNEPRVVNNNALASISSLKNCESLTSIHARNNSLQTLPLVYGSVTQLYFSSNRISTIPSEFFAQLWNLYAIDLSNNSLTSLPDSYVTTSHRIALHEVAR